MEIYELIKESRIKAGLSQDVAAQGLPFELRTLQYYESGERKIPADVIPSIAKAYNDKTLLAKCLNENPAWKTFMPALDFEGLSVADAAINFIDDLEILYDLKKKAMHLLRDKKIDETEKLDWKEIVNATMKFEKSSMELRAMMGEFDDDKLTEDGV
jgi:transcriptional regulator with XRE-family HTH domain